MSRWLVLLPIALVACKKDPPAPAAKDEPAAAATRPAPAERAPDPCAKAQGEGVLTWIHDDYPAALACAKARGLPLVLDLWAPWCHTCLSMQSTVFTDRSFAADAPRFVFAALDTDRDANAPAVAKYPLSAWPTFYVVGPDEAVLARFVGAASVAQFHAFLDAGARARTGGAAGADAHLLAAERAVAAKDLATAEQELIAALAAAPADWPRRPDALVSLIGTRAKRGDLAGCVEVAEKSMAETGSAASATDFLNHATSCATDALEQKDTAVTPARVKKLREAAAARLQKLVDDPAAPLSVDDRSDAMANLRETLVALDRKAEARAVAEKQRALLDDAVAKAPTPIAAMTYNWPRADVYAFLERPLDLVPALEKSARDLPGEYDPLARLGWIYAKGGKLDEAARWTDAALKLVYGPRKVRLLNQRADIATRQGDKAAERAARAEIVKTLEALPAGQTTPEAIAKAKQVLADLDR
ncbi:MAG TPA: thioredoxin family protein [Kofleriaceae bacterium]|nr:thioredoxin family protein [Kofleriaceae bacterium]